MKPTPSLLKWARHNEWLLPLFLLAFAACGEGVQDSSDLEGEEFFTGEASLGGVRLRLMAANTTSGNHQSYDPGHGIRIFQGTNPDVVMIQEFNYGDNSPGAIRQFVDTTFGPGFSYYREGGAQIPNGVISRWPIIASGEWDDPYVSNRDFAWARIDIPGPKDLWAVSVHLLTSSSTTRNDEARSLVQYIQAHVPPGDYLVIGGDLNTGSRSESAFSTLSQVVTTSGPFPVDQNGNGHTNATRARPYDHVLVDGDLLPYQTATVIGGSSYAAGLVVDTRVYTPLSELYPAQYDDSGASNMQHMAVIKDFLIPGDTSTDGGTGADGGTGPLPDGGTGADGGTDGGTGTPLIILNEILANEPGSDVSGEFVELLNVGTGPANLSGWTVSDAAAMRHTFPSGTSLPAGAALVVYGGAAGIPAGLTNAVAASTGGLSLGNSGDTVTVRNASGVTVDSFTYPSSLASVDGVSMNRNPDASGSGSFVLHTNLSSLPNSPGKRVDGTDFGGGSGGGSDGGTDGGTVPGDVITSESEPNDTAASANARVARDIDVSGAISSSVDNDWFIFQVDSASTVTITLTMTAGADLDWYLYSASNTTNFLTRGYTVNNPEQGSYSAAAGTYYLRVVGYMGAMDSYKLNISGSGVRP
jgi:endonuclease/exonuclease/phosphatase family metal-dependent hydrolase